MAGEWPVVSVADLESQKILLVQDGNHGEYRPRPDEFVSSGVAFIRAADMNNGRILFESASKINDVARRRITKGVGRPGDILLSHKGTVGKVASAPMDCPEFVCSPQTTFWRTLDGSKLDRGYLHAYLNGQHFREQLASRSAETDMAPYVSLTSQRGLSLILPPITTQQAISRVLRPLDDKIDLNRRMNATLEGISRAIFKSWFVDFDPVRQKAAGKQPVGMDAQTAALFPDSFEDSDIGEVPKGWSVAALGDLCSRVSMGPFGSDIKTSNFVSEGVPVVRGGNLTGGFREDDFVFLTEEKADELKNANAGPEDLVITHRGTLGQVGLIPQTSRYRRYVVSQSQMLLSVNRQLTTPRFIYDFLVSPRGQHELLANTSQTGVPAISRPTASVRSIRVVAPPHGTSLAYESVTGPAHRRQEALVREIRTLASLRDTLLPKLLSGEIRAPEAEQAVEEAAK